MSSFALPFPFLWCGLFVRSFPLSAEMVAFFLQMWIPSLSTTVTFVSHTAWRRFGQRVIFLSNSALLFHYTDVFSWCIHFNYFCDCFIVSKLKKLTFLQQIGKLDLFPII